MRMVGSCVPAGLWTRSPDADSKQDFVAPVLTMSGTYDAVKGELIGEFLLHHGPIQSDGNSGVKIHETIVFRGSESHVKDLFNSWCGVRIRSVIYSLGGSAVFHSKKPN